MGFWTDKLWFESLGFIDRFWIEFTVKLLCGVLSFLIGGIYMFLLLFRVNKLKIWIKVIFSVITAMITAMFGVVLWEEALQFFNRVPAGTADPVFGLDVSFYMFSLPFITGIYRLLMMLSVISIIAGFLILNLRTRIFLVNRVNESSIESEKNTSGPFIVGSALVIYCKTFIFLMLLDLLLFC